MDGAPLTKPIELPQRSAMNKGTKGTKVPLDDDGLITINGRPDGTMYREGHYLKCIHWSHGERVTRHWIQSLQPRQGRNSEPDRIGVTNDSKRLLRLPQSKTARIHPEFLDSSLKLSDELFNQHIE